MSDWTIRPSWTDIASDLRGPGLFDVYFVVELMEDKKAWTTRGPWFVFWNGVLLHEEPIYGYNEMLGFIEAFQCSLGG